MKPSGRTTPWDCLLAGRFDSKRPGRTLWGLFADQRRRVFTALGFYVLKQASASLLPLFVGMMVAALTPPREGSLRNRNPRIILLRTIQSR
jgi:hypothetical protein